jgi:hypothetical protein
MFYAQPFGRPGMLEAKLDSISCSDQPKSNYAKNACSPERGNERYGYDTPPTNLQSVSD